MLGHHSEFNLWNTLLALFYPLLDISSLFFKRLTTQLLHGAEEWDLNLGDKSAVANDNDMDATILFVGEAFARICRRGSAGILKFLEPEVHISGNPHPLT